MAPRAPGRDCPLCPRLVRFRANARAAHREWHNAPVAPFGGLDAHMLIVGLAPGLRGANRTGRPFTGDFAGDLLYATLARFGFAAGAYPATVLAWMQVVRVLSGNVRFGRGTQRLRNGLLGLQFTFAVILTTMVFVIDAQNAKVDEAAHVFDRDHIVNLLKIRQDMHPSYDRLVQELKAVPGVRYVSGESFVPFDGGQSLREIAPGRDPEERIVANAALFFLRLRLRCPKESARESRSPGFFGYDVGVRFLLQTDAAKRVRTRLAKRIA